MTRALFTLAVSFSVAKATRPTSINFAGGGFTTMTQAMGLGRALAMVNGWPEITHVGSNSGGSWFASQLFYSETFFANLTDTSLPIGSFVATWGQLYQEVMDGAVESGALWATAFDPGSFNALHPVCEVVGAALARALVGICGARAFPAWAWLPFVAAMLKPWIADVETATFGGRAMTGLAHATLVQQATLPPDVFLDGGSDVATRAVAFVPPFAPNTTSAAFVVPLAHATPPASSGAGAAWLRSPNIAGITATTGPRGQVVDLLQADRDPLIIEMAAASSSAAGYFGSPSCLSETIPELQGTPVSACWPLGLETLAAPMLRAGYTLPTGSAALNATLDPADVLYRFLDGSWTDNTNAAFTLARMQAECAAGGSGLDCAEGYRMIVAGSDLMQSLFLDPAHPPGSFYPAHQNPAPAVFADPAPPPAALVPFATLPQPEGSTAYYWHGDLTTVENSWFGVVGGQKVDLLYFVGFANPLIVAGSDAAQIFAEVYAPSAEAQAIGSAPIIKSFLAGLLPY